LFRYCGLEVHRFIPGTSPEAALIAALSAHRIDLVMDIGANIGQFAQSLRELGYRGRIVSFEPIPSAHDELVAAARHDDLWQVAERMAIGSETGEIEIHVAANSVSSSALPMLESHRKAAPASAYVRNEKAPLQTLDIAASQYLRPNASVFLKIDTQGYEDRVLRGGANVLRQVLGLQIELSFVPLYEGQRLYDEMVAELNALGFELWCFAPAFVDPANGRMLQADATFFRPQAR
jgi:FkbM family methyltransferase